MSKENEDEPEGTWSPMHESVIVGYFCQAVGYLIGKAEGEPNIDKNEKQRLSEAINLSHNPFDPAVGDIIYKLKETKEFPNEYFIFEIKLEWLDGIAAERAKFAKKWKLTNKMLSQIEVKANALQAAHKKAHKAHLFGALAKVGPAHAGSNLLVYPYWATICNSPHSIKDRVPVIRMLKSIFNGEMSESGFNGEELGAYVKALNEGSEENSKARTGSLRLVYAIKNYEMYLLQEHDALDLANAEQIYKNELASTEDTSNSKSGSNISRVSGKLGKRF